MFELIESNNIQTCKHGENIVIDDGMLLRSEDGIKLYPKLRTVVWFKIGTGWFLLLGGNGLRLDWSVLTD